MKDLSYVVCLGRGVLGAALGGFLGYWAFVWLFQQGLYAIILPGALLGLGFELLCRRRSMAGAILCAVSALALGIWSEWSVAPFAADKSLGFFLAHLHHLSPIKLILIALGALFAYWFGLGRQSATPMGSDLKR